MSQDLLQCCDMPSNTRHATSYSRCNRLFNQTMVRDASPEYDARHCRLNYRTMRPSRMFRQVGFMVPGHADRNHLSVRARAESTVPRKPPPSPVSHAMISLEGTTATTTTDRDNVQSTDKKPKKAKHTKTERKTRRLLVPKMSSDEDSEELVLMAGRTNRLSTPNMLLEGYKSAVDKAFDDFSIFGADSPNNSDHEGDDDTKSTLDTKLSTPLKESNGQGRLLLVSLLENFCDLYDQDPDKNRRLFLALCRRLSSMGVPFFHVHLLIKFWCRF